MTYQKAWNFTLNLRVFSIKFSYQQPFIPILKSAHQKPTLHVYKIPNGFPLQLL
jgi:hypothetical protein